MANSVDPDQVYIVLITGQVDKQKGVEIMPTLPPWASALQNRMSIPGYVRLTPRNSP